MSEPLASLPAFPARRARSGSEQRRKYANLTIRLLPEERAQIEADAERAGLSLGGYVRVRMLAHPTTRAVRRPPVEYAVLGQLMAQLGRIGGNLAQLVKRVNFGEGVARQEIENGIADWREIAAKIKEILGMGGASRANDY